MITFKYEDEQTTITYMTEKVFLPDVISAFRAFLLSVEFSPESIAEHLPGDV